MSPEASAAAPTPSEGVNTIRSVTVYGLVLVGPPQGECVTLLLLPGSRAGRPTLNLPRSAPASV